MLRSVCVHDVDDGTCIPISKWCTYQKQDKTRMIKYDDLNAILAANLLLTYTLYMYMYVHMLAVCQAG